MTLGTVCELENVEFPLDGKVFGIGLYDAIYFCAILLVIQTYNFV